MKKVMIGLFALAFLASVGIVSAQGTGNILSKAADQSIAFRVYNGYTGTVSYVVGTDTTRQTNSITLDGLVNTKICQGTETNGYIVTLAASVLACTNAGGTASLQVDYDSALTNDATTGKLLGGTYTATAGNWLEILWDTTAVLHYDIYIPDRDNQKSRANLDIVNINSVPTGTGNVTAGVYIDGVLKWQKVITSPTYVTPSAFTFLTHGGTTDVTTTNTFTYTADANVTVQEVLDIPVKASQAAIVRVSRATTATTGNIAVNVQ